MKSYFDRVEDQLHAAAQVRIAGTQVGRRRSPHRWLGALPVMVAVAVTVLIAGGALLLLRAPRSQTHHGPAALPTRPAGPQPPPAGQQYVARAFNVAYRVGGCSPARPAQRGIISRGTPSRALRRLLPILNRPQTRQDQLPPTLPLRFVGGAQGRGIYVRYIRLLRRYHGMSFYLVPIARVGLPAVPTPVAERCYQAAVRSLREQLTHVAPGLRRRTLRYGLYQFAEWRYNLTHQTVQEGVSVHMFSGRGGGGTGGIPVTTITHQGVLGATQNVWYGLVPSRVDTVTLKFPGGRQGHGELPPLRVTGRVVNNLFTVTVRGSGPLRSWPTTTVWRNSSGRIIKTINERPFHP